jgi:hypothetical protein
MNLARPAFTLQAMARQAGKQLKNSPGEATVPTKSVISQEIM